MYRWIMYAFHPYIISQLDILFPRQNFPLPLERIQWLWKHVSATENKTFSAIEKSEFGVNI